MAMDAVKHRFYTLYANYLARRFINKLLRLDAVNRREYLLSKNFVMCGYSKDGDEETRIYIHKGSGLKITDKHFKKVVP